MTAGDIWVEPCKAAESGISERNAAAGNFLEGGCLGIEGLASAMRPHFVGVAAHFVKPEAEGRWAARAQTKEEREQRCTRPHKGTMGEAVRRANASGLFDSFLFYLVDVLQRSRVFVIHSLTLAKIAASSAEGDLPLFRSCTTNFQSANSPLFFWCGTGDAQTAAR